METDIFFSSIYIIFFYQNNFGPCQRSHQRNGFTYEKKKKKKKLSVLKDEIQKEYNKLKHLKISIIGTSHVVMLCTLPFLFYSYNTFYNM